MKNIRKRQKRNIMNAKLINKNTILNDKEISDQEKNKLINYLD